MSHMGFGSGAIIVTCGVKAKEERARHGKGQYPDGCNHEGHPPAGALSRAMLVVNWHDHCSVPVKGRGENRHGEKGQGRHIEGGSRETIWLINFLSGKRKIILMEKEKR